MRWKFLIQYSHSLWKLLCVINLLIASTLSNQDNLPMGMKVRASKCSQLCEPWFLKLFLYWISETILVSLSYVKAKCSDSYLPQEPEWVTHCVSWDSHSSDPSVCLCFTSCRRNESQPKSLFKKIYIFLLALQSFQMEAIITWQKSLWMSVFPLHNPKCMVGLEGLCSSSLPRPQRSDRRSLSPHQPSRSKCAKDNKRNPRTASSKTSPQHFSPFSTKIYFLLEYFHMKLTYFLLKHSPNAGTWEGFGVTIALVRSHQALGRAPQTPAHSWAHQENPNHPQPHTKQQGGKIQFFSLLFTSKGRGFPFHLRVGYSQNIMTMCAMDSPSLLTLLVAAGAVLTQEGWELSFVSAIQQFLVDPAIKI